MIDSETLLINPYIIRNKLKIYSTRKNTRVLLEIQKEFSSFSNYLWGFINHKPIINSWKFHEEVPVPTDISEKISKDLKKKEE